MILHGQIQKVQFNAPKEGELDLSGKPAKGLYQVFWTDASRPADFRITQTLKTYASPAAIEGLQSTAGNPDLIDEKLTIVAAEFKHGQSGVFVRGTLFLGHLTGDQVKDAKAAALAAKPTTPATVVVGPANGPGTVVTTGAAPAKDKAKTA